jgi:hypothetical protein
MIIQSNQLTSKSCNLLHSAVMLTKIHDDFGHCTCIHADCHQLHDVEFPFAEIQKSFNYADNISSANIQPHLRFQNSHCRESMSICSKPLSDNNKGFQHTQQRIILEIRVSDIRPDLYTVYISRATMRYFPVFNTTLLALSSINQWAWCLQHSRRGTEMYT